MEIGSEYYTASAVSGINHYKDLPSALMKLKGKPDWISSQNSRMPWKNSLMQNRA